MQQLFRPAPQSFKNTFCVFTEVAATAVAQLTLQYQSKSGSLYYYTPNGMYRLSTHWGRLANSKWHLVALEPETPSKTKLGFATWDSFYPDNTTEKIYYLEANYNKNTVTYQHKNNPNYDFKAVLRTSPETAKKIKQIRNLQQRTAWASHFDFEDIQELRKKIINDLIFTNKTVEEIKRLL